MAAHDYLCKNGMQCEYEPPMRGDGSRHWLDVSWSDEALFQEDICVDKDLVDYIRNSGGCAGKHTRNNKITMQQFDPAITGGRNSWFSSQLSTLERIYKLSREMMLPNDFEKELIAQFTVDGFVTVINGRPKIMIPYFTREEFTAFRNIMDNEVIPSAEAEAGTMLAVNYGNFIEGYIPSYLSKEEKAFVRSRFYVPNAFTYLLMKSGKLTMPTEEECKRICSIVWER